MKVWIIAHSITLLSLALAVYSTIFISPYAITGLVATVFIFQSAERIRGREKRIALMQNFGDKQ